MFVLGTKAECERNSGVNTPVILKIEAVHCAARAATSSSVVHFVVAVGTPHRSVEGASWCVGAIPVNVYVSTTRVRDVDFVHIFDQAVSASDVMGSPGAADKLACIDVE